MEYGLSPTVTVGVAAGEKFPVPSPSSTVKVLSVKLATAMSRCPSPLKSPTAMEYGLCPTTTVGVVAGVKFPAPSPNRIDNVPE